MVRNIKICPRNYLKTPTELVQNFITIEFAVVENPYTRTQNIKFPTREKVGLHGIQPKYTIHFTANFELGYGWFY